MQAWFDKFIIELGDDEDRIRSMSKRIELGLHTSKLIKEKANSPGNTIQCRNGMENTPTLVEAKWDFLPGVYFVANRSRAIVVAPFFLPRIDQKESIGVFNDRVEMIGFETLDPRIVDAVHIEIERIRTYIMQHKT